MPAMSRILIIHNPRSRRGGQCHSNMKRWLEAAGLDDGVGASRVSDDVCIRAATGYGTKARTL